VLQRLNHRHESVDGNSGEMADGRNAGGKQRQLREQATHRKIKVASVPINTIKWKVRHKWHRKPHLN